MARRRRRKPAGDKDGRRRRKAARWFIEACAVPVAVAAMPYIVTAGQHAVGALGHLLG